MVQIKKVEGEIEIKCDGDKFFDVWVRNPNQVSKICPHKYPKIELHQGNNWHAVGAIMTWNYISPISGNMEFVKTKVEEIDEEHRWITYSIVDGDLMRKYYTRFKDKIEIIPKSRGSSVKWSVVECEQKSEYAPNPKIYLDFLLTCAKDIDLHLRPSP